MSIIAEPAQIIGEAGKIISITDAGKEPVIPDLTEPSIISPEPEEGHAEPEKSAPTEGADTETVDLEKFKAMQEEVAQLKKANKEAEQKMTQATTETADLIKYIASKEQLSIVPPKPKLTADELLVIQNDPDRFEQYLEQRVNDRVATLEATISNLEFKQEYPDWQKYKPQMEQYAQNLVKQVPVTGREAVLNFLNAPGSMRVILDIVQAKEFKQSYEEGLAKGKEEKKMVYDNGKEEGAKAEAAKLSLKTSGSTIKLPEVSEEERVKKMSADEYWQDYTKKLGIKPIY